MTEETYYLFRPMKTCCTSSDDIEKLIITFPSANVGGQLLEAFCFCSQMQILGVPKRWWCKNVVLNSSEDVSVQQPVLDYKKESLSSIFQDIQSDTTCEEMIPCSESSDRESLRRPQELTRW